MYIITEECATKYISQNFVHEADRRRYSEYRIMALFLWFPSSYYTHGLRILISPEIQNITSLIY